MVFGYIGRDLARRALSGWEFMDTTARQRARPRLDGGDNENSVVSSVRTLNTAEIAYAQAHRDAGYTCSLSELSGAWGISPSLARGQKNGYVFELQGLLSGKGQVDQS